MVVVSVAIAGIVPLVNQVFSTLHVVAEGSQGHFLAQAVLEQARAQFAAGKTFDEMDTEECVRWDGAFWEQGSPWNCRIDVSVLQDTATVTVTLSQVDTGEVFVRQEKDFAWK